MKLRYKETILSVLKRQGKKSLTRNELFQKSHVKKRYKASFVSELDQLVKIGDIYEEQGRYLLTANAGLEEAKLTRLHATFGFATLPSGEEVFIPGRYLRGAMPGDKLLVKLSAGAAGDLTEGKVQRIVEASDALLSGEVSIGDEGTFLLPDSGARYPLPLRGDIGTTQNGDKVLAKLVKRGERHADHVFEILHNFGNADSPENSAAAILAAAGIDRGFTEEHLVEADRMARRGITEADLDGRVDLRGETIITIDGAATKDIDDAISIAVTEDGYRLGVHIADVSHYVTPGSLLDTEAFERGTSVYYVDQVIPMLPPGLSNGICSLNPGEDRLAFSVYVDIDFSGTMTGYTFFKSVIRSRIKGVYSEINALLRGEADEAVREKYRDLTEAIDQMAKLAELLHKRRQGRGALELESTESKFMMNAEGGVADILPHDRGQTEEMIESFMLMANGAAAAFAEDRELPFIFRIHENPPPTKIEALKKLLDLLGFDSREVEPGVSPAALSRVLKAAKATPYGPIVNNSLLRSMAKAVYSDHNIGHYGLVMKQYSHFTSPIRRYPDLAIHRIMSEVLSGEATERVRTRYAGKVHDIASQSSAAEQRAVTAERACVDVYKAAYMRPFIGETFTGTIVSTTPIGFYVALPNTVEGLVRADRLPGGGYDYDGHMAFTSKTTGKVYRVGDTVQLVLSGVSVSLGRIDFDLVPAANA